MINHALLGPWIKRFLMEYLTGVKNLSSNTQRSYRDTFCLLLPFMARQARKMIDQLTVEDISPERLRLFLLDLEQTRHSSIMTRNQRLAAIHSLAQFIGLYSPEHIQWNGHNQGYSFQKSSSFVNPLSREGGDGCFTQLFRRHHTSTTP